MDEHLITKLRETNSIVHKRLDALDGLCLDCITLGRAVMVFEFSEKRVHCEESNASKQFSTIRKMDSRPPASPNDEIHLDGNEI